MKRPNPLHPDLMSPAERRAELAVLLALGVVRLLCPQSSDQSVANGDSSLHFQSDQSGTAGAKHRRAA
jgi:hypothetical protein